MINSNETNYCNKSRNEGFMKDHLLRFFSGLGQKNRKNRPHVTHITHITHVTLLLTLVILLASCGRPPAIGDIVFEAPITALMFEMGVDDGVESGGVIYRKVNDIDLLLASEKVPVLMVFMDGRALSNSAIPFTEELCDRFSKTARIVRVNIGLSDNTDEMDRLLDQFKVSEYPWFAVTYKGQKKSATSGYSADIENDVIKMIQNATK